MPSLFADPNWLPDSTYDFDDNPCKPCLDGAYLEQRGRREAAEVLKKELERCKPGRRHDRLETELRELMDEIAAVNSEIEMATGIEVLA